MKPPPILLIGAGGHATACIGVVEAEGRFRIAGLVGREEEERGSNRLGYPVLGTDADLETLLKKIPRVLIDIGQIRSPKPRMRAYARAARAGAVFPVVQSPGSAVSRHASLGPGTIVMPGAIVQAGARIGINCILNSQSLIEHGTRVGDHSHISTGAILNGDCQVGCGCFVGSGAVLQEGLQLKAGTVVPMGAVIRRRRNS